ncbi:MAG: hypothetical protein RIQ53_2876, partial [Pseudomonadota bacterium]
LLKLQNLERKAFGLGDGDDPVDAPLPPADDASPDEHYRWLASQRA